MHCAHRLDDAEIQEIVAEMRAHQELGGQIGDGARAVPGVVGGRADPALQHAVAHRIGERHVVIVLGGKGWEFALHVEEIVQEGILDGLLVERGAPVAGLPHGAHTTSTGMRSLAQHRAHRHLLDGDRSRLPRCNVRSFASPWMRISMRRESEEGGEIEAERACGSVGAHMPMQPARRARVRAPVQVRRSGKERGGMAVIAHAEHRDIERPRDAGEGLPGRHGAKIRRGRRVLQPRETRRGGRILAASRRAPASRCCRLPWALPSARRRVRHRRGSSRAAVCSAPGTTLSANCRRRPPGLRVRVARSPGKDSRRCPRPAHRPTPRRRGNVSRRRGRSS